MDRQTYLKRFSRAARWRLPRTEAEEVLADLEDILSHRPQGEEALPLQELGGPVPAVRMLSEPRAYHRWLAAFGLMELCLLLLASFLLRGSFYRYPSIPVCILFALGAGASLLWFRPRRGEAQRGPLPGGLLPLLAVLLAVLAAAAAVMAGLILRVWAFLPPELYGRAAHGTLLLAGMAGAVLGSLGLVRARLWDRRWRALYVLGAAVLAECVLVFALLVTLDGASSDWLRPYLPILGAVGVAGLAGTGASLC